MPTFDFSLPKKKIKERKTSNSINVYEVLERNVEGIVNISINADYYIKCENGDYKIMPECYSCKGKSTVYRQSCYDLGRFVYIRCVDEYIECNPLHWIPFAPGCVVSGNIVLNKTTKRSYFKIKKCWIDNDYDGADKALQFYINNHIKITDAHKIKYGNK